MLKEKILEIVSQELTDSQLVAAIESAIAANTPFTHDTGGGAEACGLNEEEFLQKCENYKLEGDNFSNLVEGIENNFTKREISFLLGSASVKSSLDKGLDEIEE